MPVGTPLTAVWQYDAGTTEFVDNTVEAALDDGTTFALLGATGDFCYFGFSRRHDALVFAQQTSGAYGALTWEYGATTSSWIRFVPVFPFNLDVTNGYMLWDPRGEDETAWALLTFTTSAPHSVSSVPDSTARYYIRVSSQASVTSISAVNSVVCRPYVTYATASDVQRQLQLSSAFSSSTLPTLFTIEEYLRGAEDELVYMMGESWRLEFEENELIDFLQYGMKTRREPIIKMLELAVFDGSNFVAKVEGRSEDFHIEPRTGMIYVATIFLDAVPPTFRRSFSARRDQGAFKRAVRVRYIHGHDFRRHPFSKKLGRIVTYKACADFVSNEDFAPLIPLGLDTITLQAKYDNWMKDYNEFIETYPKLKLY